MDRPIINIDMDNLLADFSYAIRKAAEAALGRELPDSHSWSIWEDWGIPRGAWQQIFREGVRKGEIWTKDPPLPGAVEGMWELSDAEYYLRIVTHRLVHVNDYDLAVQVTSHWLKANHIPYRSLAIIGPEPKSSYKADALVDDGAHNIKDWLLAGHDNAIVFDSPWNTYLWEECKADIPPEEQQSFLDRMSRAFTWEDVVRIVKEKVPV